jgi:hypothetical protein
MPDTTNDTTEVQAIKKVQYNVEGAEHIFEGEERVEQEYYEHINHDGPAVRIVLENGNWIEYRKLDDETMEECAFVQEQHPDGQYEAFLHDGIEVKHLDIPTAGDFFEAVNTSIQVYQSDMNSVEDVETSWTTILPAVKNDD